MILDWNKQSFTANNTFQIYVIKEVSNYDYPAFKSKYQNIIDTSNYNTSINSLFYKKDNFSNGRQKVFLKPLLLNYDLANNLEVSKFMANYFFNTSEEQYIVRANFTETESKFIQEQLKKDKVDSQKILAESLKQRTIFYDEKLKNLLQCPLLSYNKNYFVFQFNGNTINGLGDISSASITLNAEGASSASIKINNKDFKYNLLSEKNFDIANETTNIFDTYFCPNDIIIIRCQKRQNTPNANIGTGLKEAWKTINNIFRKNGDVNSQTDIYKTSDNDPFITCFTGYIQDVSQNIDYSSGSQSLDISCAGPSKWMLWKRVTQQQAPLSKDSFSRIEPVSAIETPIAQEDNGKYNLTSAQLLIEVLKKYNPTLADNSFIYLCKYIFEQAFELYNTVPFYDKQEKNLLSYLSKNANSKTVSDINDKRFKEKSTIINLFWDAVNIYRQVRNSTSDEYVTYLKTDDNNEYEYIDNKNNIENASVINFYRVSNERRKELKNLNIFSQPFMVITGSDQPGTKLIFQSFSNMWKATNTSLYQYIKSIADNIKYNFYDAPDGTIRFEPVNTSLIHLQLKDNPNVLTQLTSINRSQDSNSVGNIQFAKGSSIYSGVDYSYINCCLKDYNLIKMFGEKELPDYENFAFSDINSLYYAGMQEMFKANRKAYSTYSVNLIADPSLQIGRYAYIKNLKVLFYVTQISHNFSIDSTFTTTINGTYELRKLFNIVFVPEKALAKYQKEKQREIDKLNKDYAEKQKQIENKYKADTTKLNNDNTRLTNANNALQQSIDNNTQLIGIAQNLYNNFISASQNPDISEEERQMLLDNANEQQRNINTMQMENMQSEGSIYNNMGEIADNNVSLLDKDTQRIMKEQELTQEKENLIKAQEDKINSLNQKYINTFNESIENDSLNTLIQKYQRAYKTTDISYKNEIYKRIKDTLISFGFPDNEFTEYYVKAMYCNFYFNYYDGFIWEVPFDSNPYVCAMTIKNEFETLSGAIQSRLTAEEEAKKNPAKKSFTDDEKRELDKWARIHVKNYVPPVIEVDIGLGNMSDTEEPEDRIMLK